MTPDLAIEHGPHWWEASAASNHFAIPACYSINWKVLVSEIKGVETHDRQFKTGMKEGFTIDGCLRKAEESKKELSAKQK